MISDHLSFLSLMFCQLSQNKGNVLSEHLYKCGVTTIFMLKPKLSYADIYINIYI